MVAQLRDAANLGIPSPPLRGRIRAGDGRLPPTRSAGPRRGEMHPRGYRHLAVAGEGSEARGDRLDDFADDGGGGPIFPDQARGRAHGSGELGRRVGRRLAVEGDFLGRDIDPPPAGRAQGRREIVDVREGEGAGRAGPRRDRWAEPCRRHLERNAKPGIFGQRCPADEGQASAVPGRLRDVAEGGGRVPCIGNGDVKTPFDAKRMIDDTGCDGVMIARAMIIIPNTERELPTTPISYS